MIHGDRIRASVKRPDLKFSISTDVSSKAKLLPGKGVFPPNTAIPAEDGVVCGLLRCEG